MPALTLHNLLAELEKKRHRPVYLLLGTEAFQREEALNALKEYAFAVSPRDFNYGAYDCAEGDVDQALATARTLPMMGAMRLVVLRGVDRIADDGGKAPAGRKRVVKGRAPGELLEEYVLAPEPLTVLVLLADKLDRRRKLARQIEKVAGLLDLKPLRARELPQWTAERARRRGMRLERDVAGMLADVIGNDLGAIDQSLEKLALYVGEARPVTVADIEVCVARTKIHAVFEIMDAVGQRRVDHALTLLHRLLSSPDEAPLRVLSVLTRQIRRLWQVQSMMSAGVPTGEVAGRIGVRDFLVDDLVRQARLFNRRDFVRALDLLYDTDRALKTTGALPVRVLELLVLGLCAPS